MGSYTNIISTNAITHGDAVLQNFDEFGDGTSQSGLVSSKFSKFPGGIAGHLLVAIRNGFAYVSQ